MAKADLVEKLCIEYYKEELDRDDLYSVRNGKRSPERLLEQLQKKHGKKEGAAMFNRWAMWNESLVKATLESMEVVNDLVKSKKLKKKKTTDKSENFDKDYVYELSVEVYKRIVYFVSGKKKVDGLLPWQFVLKKHTDKRGKEKGLARFREYAQIKRPFVRSLLTVIEREGILPKEAKAIR